MDGSQRAIRACSTSPIEALSASVTLTPPKPRKPPSEAASATCSAICFSQALNAALSAGAFASEVANSHKDRDYLLLEFGRRLASKLGLEPILGKTSAL